MATFRAWSSFLASGLLAMTAMEARADVAVIVNRAPMAVKFSVVAPGGEPRELQLATGELVPIRTMDELALEYRGSGTPRHYQVLPNTAYFFAETAPGRGVDFGEIGLRQRPRTLAPRPDNQPAQPVVVKVKVLVDDDQQLHRRLWEKELRERIELCSQIIEAHCFARLEVVAIDTWETSDSVNDFATALAEFERNVDPAPAQLAIGFTSQYEPVKGRTNLGGVRGPFGRHVLVREWKKQAAAAERLELVTHEIGHYFGAAHSPEQNTVMRPVVADNQANSVKFRIAFDPLNALAMNVVTEAMGRGEVRSLRQLDLRSRQTLAAVYAEIERAMPKDDAARRMLAMLGPVGEFESPKIPPEIAGARRVVAGVVTFAERNNKFPETLPPGKQGRRRLTGDALAEAYFRHGAAAAAKLSPAVAAEAYLIGMAVALDTTDFFRGNPLGDKALALVETDAERERRLAVLGKPTAHERPDLLLHFVISGALTAAISPGLAESAGLVKELKDSQGGSGFSFADLSADLAGIAFAERLEQKPELLKSLPSEFRIDDFLPTIDGLPEQLMAADFLQHYGSPADERFTAVKQEIQRRIGELNGLSARQEPDVRQPR